MTDLVTFMVYIIIIIIIIILNLLMYTAREITFTNAVLPHNNT